MHYGKIKALTILAVPLLLTLAFIVAAAALAEANAPGSDAAGPAFPARAVAGPGPVLGSGPPHATSAATGSLVITDVEVSEITATSARITWATSESGDSAVRYGTSPDSLSFSATVAATGTAHSVGLANLTPDTWYFFKVESTDDQGNTVVDDNQGELHRFTTREADLPRRAFTGVVAGDPGATVTLVLEGTREERTIILPEDFILKTPGGPRAGKFESGASVVILAQRAGEDWVALSVLVRPVQPNLPVVGVVTGLGPTSLTILDPRGQAHLLRLDVRLEDLVAGEVVTVFADNANQARGLVRAEEVRGRMQRQLDEIAETEDVPATAEEQRDLGNRARGLIQGLETHGDQQLRVLDVASQHAPDDVKGKINAARLRAQAGIEAAQSAAGRARGQLDRLEPGRGGGPGPGGDRPGPPERGPAPPGPGRGSDAGGGPGNSGGQGGGAGSGPGSSGGQGSGAGGGGSPGNSGNPGRGR